MRRSMIVVLLVALAAVAGTADNDVFSRGMFLDQMQFYRNMFPSDSFELEIEPEFLTLMKEAFDIECEWWRGEICPLPLPCPLRPDCPQECPYGGRWPFCLPDPRCPFGGTWPECPSYFGTREPIPDYTLKFPAPSQDEEKDETDLEDVVTAINDLTVAIVELKGVLGTIAELMRGEEDGG